MSSLSIQTFRKQTLLMMLISVIAWIAFALFYRTFWPGGSAPGDNFLLFWIWFVLGAATFVGLLFACFRLFKTPPALRATAALALTAPALCCDVFTVTFFESWFANGGGADDRIYAAMILGGVGIFQLVGLFTTDPQDTNPVASRV
ncbi:MAG: DUF5367 family protein [Rhodobiaceae bacterium]|nr:DUF5367 family protein [Rhodobiaceae bacterium]